MMVKGINCDNLYIDESFASIGDLKTRIHQKYGIPPYSQHIAFNGRFYVLGLFEDLCSDNPTGSSNPFADLGCPDTLFNALHASGMSLETIRTHLLPHREDVEEKHEESILQVVDIPQVSNAIRMSKHSDISKLSADLSDEQKLFILRNPARYVELVLSELSKASSPED